MDKSETYIKMCEKAEEIQGRRPFKDDYYCESREGIIEYKNVSYVSGDKCIWLPRQDQLQEIYISWRNETRLDGYALLDNIELGEEFGDWLKSYTEQEPYSWLNKPTDIRGWVAPSMEQLWLAFVMKEKYNKIWNGEDWVKA